MGSKMNEEIIDKVHDYVKKLFEENSVPENFYHNFEHTNVKVMKMLAKPLLMNFLNHRIIPKRKLKK
ncbi:MAG: hypothetical protein P8Y79_12855 [Ignavibacteriaceae bacterium]